jgi:glycine dehydrogenase subunit 2
MGAQGLKAASEMAVLNANYMQARLKEDYVLPFDTICKHEFVLDGLKGMSEMGVTTLDVAKRLLDHGYHPPTVYFPLIVHNALMIEPTETESLETLDIFCDVMIEIAKEAKEAPELLTQAPTTTVIRRVDEVRAARKPVLSWTKEAE